MATAQVLTREQALTEVVRHLAGDAIQASLYELNKRAELEAAIRQSLKQGTRVEDLSEASGYTPDQIRKIASAEPQLGTEDLELLTGLV